MDDIETICANSFRNFHARGMDYLCLSRSDELTRKVYFFEGNLADLPEIVMPHDHRYPFVTTVLSGAVVNKRFRPLQVVHPDNVDRTPLWDAFEYRTPLNGGDGFTWQREQYMVELDADPIRGGFAYTRCQSYRSSETDVHTLDVRCEGTVILLEQLADVVPLDEPTRAWRPVGDRTPPNLSGLYDRMTPDHARTRIAQFLDLIGNR